MSQRASQVSTRSAPVAARERHCRYSCSALLSCPPPLTPVPSSSQASFHFVQKTQFLRSIMLLIVSGGTERNHSRNTVNRLSNCIALWRKRSFQAQCDAGSGFNSCANDCQCECLSGALCVMTKWTVCDVLWAIRHSSICCVNNIFSNGEPLVMTGWSHRSSSSVWISNFFFRNHFCPMPT